MDSTTKSLTSRAVEVALLLANLKGEDTRLLDMRGCCDWTEYMLITSATGETHMRGLYRNCRQLMTDLNFELIDVNNTRGSDNWLLIDGDQLIVHIMRRDSRDFYQLEELWFQAEQVDLPEIGMVEGSTLTSGDGDPDVIDG